MASRRSKPPTRDGTTTAYCRDLDSPATVKPAKGYAAAKLTHTITRHATPPAVFERPSASRFLCKPKGAYLLIGF